MKTNNSYYFDNIASVFGFGKYRGMPLGYVISQDSSYIYWCINNIPEFTISKETLEQIRGLFPMFIITKSFSNHIERPEFIEYFQEYENGCNEDNEATYERYCGSYAQDEMGYSDDDIDIIFDGDPLAYWNID